jgi:hypothetical protein
MKHFLFLIAFLIATTLSAQTHHMVTIYYKSNNSISLSKKNRNIIKHMDKYKVQCVIFHSKTLLKSQERHQMFVKDCNISIEKIGYNQTKGGSKVIKRRKRFRAVTICYVEFEDILHNLMRGITSAPKAKADVEGFSCRPVGTIDLNNISYK